MTLRPDHLISAVVYPKVAPSTDNALIVTGYTVRANAPLIYLVSDEEGDETERFGFELVGEVGWSANTEETP